MKRRIKKNKRMNDKYANCVIPVDWDYYDPQMFVIDKATENLVDHFCQNLAEYIDTLPQEQQEKANNEEFWIDLIKQFEKMSDDEFLALIEECADIPPMEYVVTDKFAYFQRGD